MSVQRAQYEIPSTEFLEWISYLDEDVINGFHREDYYLASIAAEIRRSYVKNSGDVQLKDFLLEFGVKKKHKKLPIKEASRIAKQFFSVPVNMVKGKK